MNSILIVGVIVFSGFICGEIAKKIKLPKITGYIIAGVLLNPDLSGIIPANFIAHTDLVTNLCLCFITFSIGGTLLYSRIKRLGRGVLSITFCEAEFAFLAVTLGFLAVTPFFIHVSGASWFATFIPASVLLGSLASPTDPSATLAVTQEYKARGRVCSTIMGVAAFDDVFGIINFSLAIVIARVFVTGSSFSIYNSLVQPLLVVIGSIILGIAFGLIFNWITSFIKKETEGVFIVLILGILAFCFGTAKFLNFDELLSTMTMGAVVVNYNTKSKMIFKILERYTDELIFVVFFTISGMYLNFSVLASCFGLVLLFVIFRDAGKILGAWTGAVIAKSPSAIRKYTAGGLIPQGGIVIGLALIIRQNSIFNNFSDIVISIIIGATVIHEFIGPILAKMALLKAGEIKEGV